MADGAATLRRLAASVRVRVTVATVVVATVAVGVAAWALVRAVETSLVDDLRASDASELSVVEAQLAQGQADQAVEGAQGEVALLDQEGNVVTATPGAEQLFGRSEFSVALPSETGGDPATDRVYQLEGGPGDAQVLSRSVQTPSGTFTLVAASPLEPVRHSVDAVQRSLGVVLPVFVLALGVAAWFLTGRALRPVEAVRAEVEEISHSTLHRRVPVPPSSDEVARLATTMNEMLDRLEASAGRQRRFVADASHELRSPVAGLRTGLEVALRGDDTDWPAAAESALAEEGRLESLIDDLLLLASLDETRPTPAEAVDVSTLLTVEAERCRDLEVKVVGAGPEDDPLPEVRGDERRLRRAFANLVDNAARHATGQVVVTAGASEGGVVLTVDDDGDGLAAEDRPLVLERFTRLDEARARDAGGAGLGLPMAAEIVASHGGTLDLDDAPLGGLRVRVWLPAA
jgi:signal transduction histidine kinase